AAGGRPEPVAELRRGRLYRDQADRIERIDRRAFDFAGLGVLRPGAAAWHGDPGLGERERRPETPRTTGPADRRLIGLALPLDDCSPRWSFRVKLLDHRRAAGEDRALVDRALVGELARIERGRVVHQDQAGQAA